MTYNPRSSSSYSRKSINFYSTTLHPPSYYSPKKSLYFQRNNITYTLDSSPKSENRNIDNINKEKNIGLFSSSSNMKRIKASPFYNNEKSLRLQNEIDWINKIVTRKAIINKINTEANLNSNSMNDFINNEEKEISDLLRNKIKIEQLNNQLSNRHNKSYNLKYKQFNYVDPCSFSKKDSIPLIIATKYKKSGLFSKNDFDNYNHKIFMNEMIKFKNNGVNKWRKDFNNKFNEY
jgi:hypothetical protein